DLARRGRDRLEVARRVVDRGEGLVQRGVEVGLRPGDVGGDRGVQHVAGEERGFPGAVVAAHAGIEVERGVDRNDQVRLRRLLVRRIYGRQHAEEAVRVAVDRTRVLALDGGVPERLARGRAAGAERDQ